MDSDNKGNISPFKRNRSSQDEDEDHQVIEQSPTLDTTPRLEKKKVRQPIQELEFFKRWSQKKEEGDQYLVSKVWFREFEAFAFALRNLEGPGEIDNSSLLEEDGSLRTDIVEEKDYFLLPYRAWSLFVRWHGLLHPSHSLIKKDGKVTAQNRAKRVKTHGSNPDMTMTDNSSIKKTMAPMPITLTLKFTIYKEGDSNNKSRKFSISSSSTVGEFYGVLLNTLNLPPETQVEMWLLKRNLIENSRQAFTFTRQILNNKNYASYIDTENIDFETTISAYLAKWFNISSGQEFHQIAVSYTTKKSAPASYTSPGLCGLQNLGNTCYMNSALQCLSNTPQLTQWFINGNYKKDINTVNPLGLRGDLAGSFANIIKSIWSNNLSARPLISPKEFKSTFERFNPHFIGYQQQDSQEMISFLLDGLHEDLNRILKKPYIELPDYNDSLPDKEIAACFWNYHKARNDSIIVDLFQGQFKSRLTCDECKKVSVTFDPFMYLSLPLPVETKSEIVVVYVPYVPSHKLLKMTVHLALDATISQLKQEVENSVVSHAFEDKEEETSLMVVEVHEGRIFRLFTDSDPVTSIRAADTIYVYQLPCPSTEINHDDWILFPVYCATKVDTQIQSIPSSQFGHPIILAVGANSLQSTDDLYKLIYHFVQRYCIVKLLNEEEESPKSQESNADDSSSQAEVTQTIATVSLKDHLFDIKIFNHPKSAVTKSHINFPTGSSIYWKTDLRKDAFVIKQGQGVMISWDEAKAQEVFGTPLESVSTSTWRDYEEIASTTTKKTTMTTRFSLPTSIKASTLEDCLDLFTNDEKLSSNDLWYCPRCKKHQRASKKFDIWKLPDILVVHLKRFSQVRRWGNKIDSFIDFPIHGLDMTDRVLSSQFGDGNSRLIYDLYAVDNHYGGMGGGHYTAFAQNAQNELWYNFDDSHVTKLSASDIKTNAAYLLFYKRRRVE